MVSKIKIGLMLKGLRDPMVQEINKFKGNMNLIVCHQIKLASTAEPELGTVQPQLVLFQSCPTLQGAL